MILHEITRAVFMAAGDQQVIPGYHDVPNLLANLESPGWFEETVVPITRNLCYATAKACPYKGSSLSTRPLKIRFCSYSTKAGIHCLSASTLMRSWRSNPTIKEKVYRLSSYCRVALIVCHQPDEP